MASNVEKVIELIDKLNTDEKRRVLNKLKGEVNDSPKGFFETINERAIQFPVTEGQLTNEAGVLRGINQREE